MVCSLPVVAAGSHALRMGRIHFPTRQWNVRFVVNTFPKWTGNSRPENISQKFPGSPPEKVVPLKRISVALETLGRNYPGISGSQQRIEGKRRYKQNEDLYQYQFGRNLGRTRQECRRRFLLSRQGTLQAEIPDGVLLLTAGVDVQDDRFEVEITGWGRGYES